MWKNGNFNRCDRSDNRKQDDMGSDRDITSCIVCVGRCLLPCVNKNHVALAQLTTGDHRCEIRMNNAKNVEYARVEQHHNVLDYSSIPLFFMYKI